PLTGLQAKQLDTALLSAFSIEDLSRLTWFELNVQLEDFASTGSKASVTFKLIKWAEQRGKTAELIRAVIAARPNNPEVAALGGLLPPA
ncbi:effector-associated domain EAD1-containing protein, partial [Acinetobacter baumannii]